MRFKSTRASSSSSTISFEEAVFEGLAPDGGLYVPDTIPQLPLATILSWHSLPFAHIAYNILSLYISSDEIPAADLRKLLETSFGTFSHPDVVPLVELPVVQNRRDMYALELFHGPTFAFKDVALQVLGNLFEYFLVRQAAKGGKSSGNSKKSTPPHITVVGATSGDTGGAAIYGLRGKKAVEVIILHPHNRVSPIQELQMTTVQDANVHNVAVEGTFDDCQEIVKNLFGDLEFKEKYHLAAINSINAARILAQIIYYFTSYLALVKRTGVIIDSNGKVVKGELPKVQYSVPTGNFGDILAGYYALRMGLPIHRLIIATNENDILTRFFESGSYARNAPSDSNSSNSASSEVRQTLSPAMDILVSSNFERLLWYLARGDEASNTTSSRVSATDDTRASSKVAGWMNELKSQGHFSVSSSELSLGKKTFDAVRASNPQTAATIRAYNEAGYLLDPHSAVGVHAAHQINPSSGTGRVYTVCLAPAHPGKFPETVEEAINTSSSNKKVSFETFAPQPLKDLRGKTKRVVVIKTGGLGKVAVASGTPQIKALVERIGKLQNSGKL
ncbi:hypothetical protein SmJEL517_g01779 [Synchytrium microbalum]|uniref:threonine synthase n=1 Tax=Synchytrium microbalum TaxID=1806994 RepID=A0A507C8S0_9FUNG|nr:uncharacterized protein SmJEL517_g01779 [Synchytrium microbalum]TPX36022.1 hypothetical protein SmJEL517_g01779 [Synchytrium microbalum]